MLRPFKSFLNNLQKNAIGATIFGSRSDMTNNNPEDEDEEEIVNENMYDSDVVDPLSDPLAIDDVVLNQSSENDGGEGGGSEFASTNTTLTELDSSADGQIILVDVNSLKNAFPATMPTVSYANCTSSSSSGSSGNTCTTTTPSHSRTSRDTFDPVESGLALNVSSDDGIGVAFEPIALALDDDEINDEIEGVRSDGSDSGLGLELSAGLILDKPNTSSTAVEETLITPTMAPTASTMPPKSRPTRSNLKRRSDPSDQIDAVDVKKPKRNIQFNGVTVYYFPRIQGFTCIPSQGGCTLGMGPRHYETKSYSLSEHMIEAKRMHRQKVLESLNLRSALSPVTMPPTPPAIAASAPVTTTSTVVTVPAVAVPAVAVTSLQPTNSASMPDDQTPSPSTEESEESEEEVLSDNSGSELDTETSGFLQPVPQRQRRALLKASGVREIVSTEKNECRDIRASREFCGCNCVNYCDPETCFCSQSGIKCQVDRASFPCGCTLDGCANRFGRIEFNPKRVRTHFIHTLMRLELEKKQKKSEKQNVLNTYDGRIRLRDSDDDNSSSIVGEQSQLQQQQPYLQQLVNYSAPNGLLYPAVASGGIGLGGGGVGGMIDMVDGHSLHCNNNGDFISASSTPTSSLSPRHTVNGILSMPESPLDLHYAFRNDYQVDIATVQDPATSTYTMYNNPSYFSSASAASNFHDYSSLSAAASPYAAYSTNLSYSGLLANDQIIHHNGTMATATIPTASDLPSELTPTTPTCVPFIDSYAHPANTLLDGSADVDVLQINAIPNVKNLPDLNSLLDVGGQQLATVDDVLAKLQPNTNVDDTHLILASNPIVCRKAIGLTTTTSTIAPTVTPAMASATTVAMNNRTHHTNGNELIYANSASGEFVASSIDESVPV